MGWEEKRKAHFKELVGSCAQQVIAMQLRNIKV